MKKLLFLILICLSASTFAQQTTPAFPSAEGYGKWALGGRGGKVVEVTNTEDDGIGDIVGSFRWALKQHEGEPITVVFKVSGIIDLKKDLRCKRNNYTIAGQTAPGDGICIKGNKVNLGGSTNFILRHLRFRIGVMENASGLGSIGIENASDFIVDHCTFGWSGEENMTIYDNKNTTIQWCIVHEGLYYSTHDKGTRGYGTQWGGSSATYHHNLLAHNHNRSPRFNGARSNDIDVLLDYVNNVNYNWGKQNSCYGGDITNSSHHVNIVNNYYKPGPARPATKTSYFIESSIASGQKPAEGQIAVWWMDGNIMEGNSDFTTNNFNGLIKTKYSAEYQDQLVASGSFEVPYPVNTESAEDAYESVLTSAGAFPRDVVDVRIVGEVRSGTASGSGAFGSSLGIIDDPDAVGGYPEYKTYNTVLDSDHDGIPDYWETANNMDPLNPDDRNNLSDEGYSYLEVYLNSIVGEYIEGFNYPDPIYEGSGIEENRQSENTTKISVTNSGSSLKIETSEAISFATVFDLSGKNILNKSGNIQTIDINTLSKGTYILQLKFKNKYIERIKFVK